jgi:hypothetical protein
MAVLAYFKGGFSDHYYQRHWVLPEFYHFSSG